MSGFSARLEELRNSSTSLSAAGDAAREAHQAVAGMDIPTGMRERKPESIFDVPFAVADNAFGAALGMPGVAAAYDQHRANMANLLERLWDNTEAMSIALRKVAELYEQNDAEHQTRLGKLGNRLDEI